MNLQNKKVKIVLGILLAVCLIVSYRIYSNVQKDKARAELKNGRIDVYEGYNSCEKAEYFTIVHGLRRTEAERKAGQIFP